MAGRSGEYIAVAALRGDPKAEVPPKFTGEAVDGTEKLTGP